MIGKRIRQARVAVGMTQQEVVDALRAEGVSLTKGGLSKYERGGSTPKPTVIRALGSVLGVHASYFLEQSKVHVHWLAFRKASQLGKTRQERIKVMAQSHLEAFLKLKHALDPSAEEVTAPPQTRVHVPEDTERAAESLRAFWNLGDQPIESVTSAIEDGGGIVVESGGEDDLFDGLSGWANDTIPVVVVSSAVSDDRRRFSLAHELGHLFVDAGDADDKTTERLAHRFAAAFLVTAATARRELGTKRRHLDFRELAMLKQKHGLSMQAWIFRAVDLGIIEQQHGRTLFAEMSNRGWRRVEPVDFKGKEQPQKLRQLTVRALAEGLVTEIEAERICPGVTRDIGDLDPIGALSARAMLRMPKSERDRLMTQSAALVAEQYENDGGLSGFESLAEEDHRDTSIDE